MRHSPHGDRLLLPTLTSSWALTSDGERRITTFEVTQ
jgi:hypothetical protein